MVSEDDTYKALRKIPYEEMKRLFYSNIVSIAKNDPSDEEYYKWYEQYGWTYDEFWEIYNPFR